AGRAGGRAGVRGAAGAKGGRCPRARPEGRGRRVPGRGAAVPARAPGALGRLLAAFASQDVATLKLGPIDFYQETPNPPPPPDDGSCPAEEGLGVSALDLQEGDVLAELAESGS